MMFSVLKSCFIACLVGLLLITCTDGLFVPDEHFGSYYSGITQTGQPRDEPFQTKEQKEEYAKFEEEIKVEETHLITVAQNAEQTGKATAPTTSLCNRSEAMKALILWKLKDLNVPKTECSQVTTQDLEAILNLQVNHRLGLPFLYFKPGDFSGLVNLKQIYFKHVAVDFPENTLQGLSNLKYFKLWQVSLKNPLPANIFQGLGGSQIPNPDNSSSGPNNLEDIWFVSESILNLPENIFRGLSKLRHLIVDSSKITSLSANIFQGLDSLQFVSLNLFGVTSLPENIFQGLNKLESLSIGGSKENKQGTPASIGGLTSLPENIFQGLSNLYSLGLGGVQLSSLPPGIFRGLSLLTLSLTGTRLSSLPINIFHNLSGRDYLAIYLNNNRFSSLPADLFKTRADNPFFYLCNNQISTLPENIDSNIFRQMRLAGNPISVNASERQRLEQIHGVVEKAYKDRIWKCPFRQMSQCNRVCDIPHRVDWAKEWKTYLYPISGYPINE